MIKDIRGTIAFTKSKGEISSRPCINLMIHCDDKNDVDTKLQPQYHIESGKFIAIIKDFRICLRIFSPTTKNYINWWLKTVKDVEGYYLLSTYIFLDGSDKHEEKWISENS